MYKQSVLFFSKIYDLLFKDKLKISTELENSCDYLNLKKGTSESVVKATLILTIISSIICITLFIIFLSKGELSIINTAILLCSPILINHFYSNYYKDKYYSEKVKDLGFLPDFFTILITYLKINPNLENALINISKFNYGKISKDIKKLVKDLENGVDWDVKKRLILTMQSFNSESVMNATNSLISSLSIKNKNRRNFLLSNSLNYLLNGMIDETKKFSVKIYTPILLLFSFGTIIPLIIISIMPVISVLSNTSFDTVMIVGFFTASIIFIKLVVDNLKKKSPSRFSQIIINKEVKSTNLFLLLILLVALSSPTIIFFLSKWLNFRINFFQDYHTIFLYAGLSIVYSTYLFSKTNNLYKEKLDAEILEKELIDSFYLLGSRINEGHSVESSLKYVSDITSKGRAKEFIKNAYYKISVLGYSVSKAFSKTHLLKNVHSQRVEGLVELFITSVSKHSISASENIIEICNYYTSIQSAEKEMFNSMSKNIDMIKLTSYFFTPLICALIINIQRLVNSTVLSNNISFLSFSLSITDIEITQLIISIYVFFLTIILSDLYSFLTTNNEEISSRKNRLNAVFTSFLVFTITLIMSRLLLF